MMRLLQKHLPSFVLYLISGGFAALVNYGSYLLLLQVGMYYVTASVVSEALGFLSAFISHKYFVFQKKGKTANHFGRYCLLGIWNTLAISIILFATVEYLHIPKEIGKLVGIGVVVLWNFFLYKFFVYID